MNIKIRDSMVPAPNYHSITLLYRCEILTSLHYSELGSKIDCFSRYLDSKCHFCNLEFDDTI